MSDQTMLTRTSLTDLRRHAGSILQQSEQRPTVVTRRGEMAGVIISPYIWASVAEEVERQYKLWDELMADHWAEVGAGLRI